MTKPTEQLIDEGWEKEFDKAFCTDDICLCCAKTKCEYSTTGCPWYRKGIVLNPNGILKDGADLIKDFIRKEIAEAIEQTRKEDIAAVEKVAAEIDKNGNMKELGIGTGQSSSAANAYWESVKKIREALSSLRDKHLKEK